MISFFCCYIYIISLHILPQQSKLPSIKANKFYPCQIQFIGSEFYSINRMLTKQLCPHTVGLYTDALSTPTLKICKTPSTHSTTADIADHHDAMLVSEFNPSFRPVLQNELELSEPQQLHGEMLKTTYAMDSIITMAHNSTHAQPHYFDEKENDRHLTDRFIPLRKSESLHPSSLHHLSYPTAQTTPTSLRGQTIVDEKPTLDEMYRKLLLHKQQPKLLLFNDNTLKNKNTVNCPNYAKHTTDQNYGCNPNYS